jgi:hypothetical protein
MNKQDAIHREINDRLSEKRVVSDSELRTIMDTVEAVLSRCLPACYAKADEKEPVFVLRGQDETALWLVQDWLETNAHVSPDKAKSVHVVLDAMRQWPTRQPD